MNSRNFFTELKRRNVYKVAVAYAAVGWLAMQVTATIVPALHLPEVLTTVVVFLVLLGLPIALVIAWAFEMTPQGMKRTEDLSPNEKLPQWSVRKFFAFVVVVALVAGALLLFQLQRPRGAESALAKSIAVLPFENLSRDPENAYFAEGIQDEILTRLAKISDLKVISRTSTQRYRSSPDDLPKIAQQLGVAHILEGSVQKAGNQVRVTVQLIRAATDSHLWAESYDRHLTDIFSVESEVAEKIAQSLQAKITGAEQQAVAARPTDNPAAYEAYLRGLALWNRIQTSPKDLDNTANLFAKAVELDPNFATAWAALSAAQSFIYSEFERTPRQLAAARKALEAALRLAPDAGETQFALGLYRYRGQRDYDGALEAFARAREQSASSVEGLEFSAYVKRRQGKWDDALALHAKSLELDPRNSILFSESALTNQALRRFETARGLIDRGLDLEPGSPVFNAQKATTYDVEGNLDQATELLANVPVDGADPNFLNAHLRHWTYLHKYDEAIGVLRGLLAAAERLPASALANYQASLGIIEALAGAKEKAQADLATAYEKLSAQRAAGDLRNNVAADLIMVAAFLQKRDEVHRLADELQDVIRHDAFGGPPLAVAIAAALAQIGDTDAALASVQQLLVTPGELPLTPAQLRLDPFWNPLRADPRFVKLVSP